MPSPLNYTQVRHVIRTHHPSRRWVLVGLGIVFLLMGSYLLYSIGRSQAEYDGVRAARLESEHHRLLAEIRRLRGENQRLSQRVVLLERTGEIDKRAAGVLDQSLKDEQSKLTALKEQVEFYRGIVSPEGYSAGVRVYELEMRRGPETALYEYNLVLIQPVRHDASVSGSVDVTLHGMQAGQARSYRLSDLDVEKGKTLLFSFKYFQELTGSLHLPAGFKPTRVQVEVVRAGAGKTQQVYNWDDVQQPAGA
jgi:hypothetical protein